MGSVPGVRLHGYECEPHAGLFRDACSDTLMHNTARDQPIRFGRRLTVDMIIWLEGEEGEQPSPMARVWRNVQNRLAKEIKKGKPLTKGKGYVGNWIMKEELEVLLRAYRACLALEAEPEPTSERGPNLKRPAAVAKGKAKKRKQSKDNAFEDHDSESSDSELGES